MKKLNQRGFSLVEGLLVVIAVALISFVGFYVYNANKDSKNTHDNSSSVVKENKAEDTQTKDEAESWQQVTSGKGAFKLKVPDGWKLNNDPAQDLILSSTDPADITYKKGQKPVISNNEVPGSDAPHRFSVTVLNEGSQNNQGTNSEFVLTSGQKGTKNVDEYEDMLGDAGLIKSHIYTFEKNGKFYVVSYSILPSDTDNTEIVEKAIRTLQF